MVSPTHSYAQNNYGYVVTHTVVTFNGTYTYSTTVFQSPPPVANIQGYPTNNCGSGFLTYTANPCLSGIVYSWSLSPVSGTLSDTTGCSTNVNWGANGGFIYLTAWDSVNDCYGYDTLEIPACCHLPSQYQIDNTTASAVLASLGCVSGNIVDGSCIGAAPIRISGVFVVNVPIVFQNCASINLSTNTAIEINSGQTLTFDNCYINDICDTMWDGIYIADQTATLRVINNSTIQHAKHAVVSNNGGNYFIENSRLQNNDTDIVVNAYSGIHAGIIRGTRFTMSSQPMLPAVPALPPGHTETVVAIEIRDNAGITIGDATSVAARNHFTDILVGVRASNSITTIKNCRFAFFTPTPIQLPINNAGTGVVAFGKKGTAYAPSLTVGGAGLNQCFFSDMIIGIDAFERIHVNAIRNQIFKVRRFGIRVQRSQQTNINVNDNIISNANYFAFNTGVLVMECYSATVNINNNNIYAPNAVPNQTGIGIRVGLVTPGDVILNVVGNKIDRLRTGIMTQLLVGKNHVYISHNTISFQKQNNQYTSIHSGIYLEKCATVRVQYNHVKKTTGSNPNNTTIRDNLRGVYFNNSSVSYISHNKFTKMGTGVFGWEDCHDSKLVCDTFNNCYDGFYFTGGPAAGNACNIGDQVVDPNTTLDAPTGCVWNNSFNSDLDGAIFPAVHWYRGSYVPSNSLTAASLITGTTTPSGNQSACDIPQFLTPPPLYEREANTGKAVFSPGSYAPGSELHYAEKRNAHQKLRENPTWISLGTPQDSIYGGYYFTNDNSNVGYFRNFEDMVAIDSIGSAISILNGISDTNLSESNLKTVYRIYSNTWLQNQFTFSTSDSILLYNIASDDAAIAGDAVYGARVLLGLQVDEYGYSSGARYSDTIAHPAGSAKTMNIYPNPASEMISIEVNFSLDDQSTIQVVDVLGRIVIDQPLMVTDKLFTISVNELPQGSYFLQLKTDGALIETEMIQIIR